MLLLFLIGASLELLILVPWFWQLRAWFIFAPIAATAFSSGMIIAARPNLISLMVLSFSLFRLVNMMRITEGRVNEKHLRRVVRRTSLVLIPLQLVLLAAWQRYDAYVLTIGFLTWLSILQFVSAVIIVLVTRRNTLKSRYNLAEKFYSDHELPTVTVAVPARNETLDLKECLEALVASDYPKLEILVLDDCSQDKTSDVIKGFAQAGVRFLHGHEPKENWLAKNQAYDELAKASTGEYIIFCGVDTRVTQATIRALVTYALAREKQMICVLPKHVGYEFIASLIQPMRYWWELSLPRRIFNRPAVLSSFWLINRQKLAELGGFGATSRSVLPEGYLARELVKTDGYSFLRTSGQLEVASIKQFKDQFDRAVRTRYPQVHRRLELVFLVGFCEAVLLLGPILLSLIGLFYGRPQVYAPAITATLLLVTTHYIILRLTSQPYRALNVLNFPLMVLVEIGLGLFSMLKYEFSVVDWKGRNICLPVMHERPWQPRHNLGPKGSSPNQG